MKHTIKNPLVLTYTDQYKVNKPGKQNGKYIDLGTVKKLVTALEGMTSLAGASLDILYGKPAENAEKSINEAEKLLKEITK